MTGARRLRSPAARLAAVFAVVMVLVIGGATPAFAHAQLESTDPSPNTVYALATPPRAVSLHFGESVGVKLGGIRLYNARGDLIVTGTPTHPDGDGSTVRATLPHLGVGTYVVTWRVISADTHPVGGAFTFSIGTKHDVSALTTRLLSTEGGSRAVGVLYGVIRFGIYASVLVFIGGVVFMLFVWPEGRASRRARRILWAAWWTALAVTIVGFAVEGIYAAAFPIRDLLNTTVLADTWHARYGEFAALRVGALIVALPLLRHLFPPGASGEGRESSRVHVRRIAVAVVSVGALIASLTFVMHATSGRWVRLALVADVFHIGGASIWLGGLVVLAVAVIPTVDVVVLDRVVPRFSRLALVCITAVALSGAFQAVRQVGSIPALRSTTYGHLLIVKLLAFAVLVVVAAFSLELVNRWYRLPAMDDDEEFALVVASPPLAGGGGGVAVLDERERDDQLASGPDREFDDATARRRLRRTVQAEVLIAIVILAVTALLVDARPAYEATTGPVGLTLKTSSLWFDVVIAPGKTGPNDVHLTAITTTGGIASPLQMTMELTNAAHDVGPLKVALLTAGPGHDLANGFQIPFAGQWRVIVTALVNATTEVTATQVVTIR